MNTVFSKEEFHLCDVPVPMGYPQSQTHVGVQKIGGVILMTTSPFPSVIRPRYVNYIRAAVRKLSFGLLCRNVIGENYENPCLYSSRDGVKFTLMQSRPLMEKPDPYFGLSAFNSDPDIFMEGNAVYVLNRMIFRTKLTPNRNRDEYEIQVFLIKGLLEKYGFKYYSTTLFKETTDLIVSPCITKYRGSYIYYSLWTNCYNDGESFEGLKYVMANTIDGLSQANNWKEVQVIGGNWIPWHMSVFTYGSRLYSIVACVKKGQPHRCWQMLGEFNEDLSKMTINPVPLTDYNSYRGAAYVD